MIVAPLIILSALLKIELNALSVSVFLFWIYSFFIKLVNTPEYLFRTSEIVLIKVETNFNFEGILTV